MKLTYVHTAAVPSLAANAVQVAKMCAAFQGEGVETTLVQPMGAGGTSSEIAVHFGLNTVFHGQKAPVLPIPGRELLFGVWAALRHRMNNGDVIYSRSASVGAAAVFVGQRFALEMHVPPSALRPKVARRLGRIIASPHFVGIVAISYRLKAELERVYPALNGRVFVAHDGAEVPGKVAPVQLAGAFRVGYVGQLYPGKGMEIIEALLPLCPWASFHIVGGSAIDVANWKERTSGYGNIIFHGHVRHVDTGGYLEGMDVVLAPYLRVVRGVGGGTQNLADWMSPLKIFEYLARGKAVVATDLPVLREVLRDEENALLCAPENIDDWARALTRLKDDDILRRQIALEGRNDFLSRYTWQQRALAILDFISKN
ncbi:MAG: glycosyltransferase family 4 protein [Parvibaculum sp.]|nr:glycosyltransferase family 4 protein [Parvibaculum sp.]